MDWIANPWLCSEVVCLLLREEVDEDEDDEGDDDEVDDEDEDEEEDEEEEDDDSVSESSSLKFAKQNLKKGKKNERIKLTWRIW